MENPFTDVEARNWFGNKIKSSPRFYKPFLGHLVILGSGPFVQNEFAQYLAAEHGLCNVTDKLVFDGKEVTAHEGGIGVTPIDPNRDFNLLIVVGKNSVKLSLLESLVHQKSFVHNHTTNSPFWLEFKEINGKPVLLRSPSHQNYEIISQEMLLSRLLLGKGLYGEDENDEYIKRHSATHPILKFHNDFRTKIQNLEDTERAEHEDQYFRWPTTEIGDDGENVIDGPEDWPEVGLLSHLGYKVGMNGVPTEERRRILENAFRRETLPNVNDQEYMDRWGGRDSASRLKKMADSIAQFTKNMKRAAQSNTGNDNDEAINDWESDLDWLKENFYVGKYDDEFNWPETEIE